MTPRAGPVAPPGPALAHPLIPPLERNPMPDWYTPDTARTALNVTVTVAGLAAAQEQCLRIRGLALNTAQAPTASFAQGVVFQALANAQASQADPSDEIGMASNGVRLYPLDRKVMALLITSNTDPDDPTRDTGYVGSLVG